jgi:hypothetical protein
MRGEVNRPTTTAIEAEAILCGHILCVLRNADPAIGMRAAAISRDTGIFRGVPNGDAGMKLNDTIATSLLYMMLAQGRVAKVGKNWMIAQ